MIVISLIVTSNSKTISKYKLYIKINCFIFNCFITKKQLNFTCQTKIMIKNWINRIELTFYSIFKEITNYPNKITQRVKQKQTYSMHTVYIFTFSSVQNFIKLKPNNINKQFTSMWKVFLCKY